MNSPVQSQVNGSSHFELLGGAFAGTLLQSASVEVDGEAVDFHRKHAVSLWNDCRRKHVKWGEGSKEARTKESVKLIHKTG